MQGTLTHCARYFNVTHCNGLALYGRLMRLVRSNSVGRSRVDAGVIRSTSRYNSRQGNIFSLFSKLFLSSLIIHDVYIYRPTARNELMYRPIHITYQPSFCGGIVQGSPLQGQCNCLLISAGADIKLGTSWLPYLRKFTYSPCYYFSPRIDSIKSVPAIVYCSASLPLQPIIVM